MGAGSGPAPHEPPPGPVRTTHVRRRIALILAVVCGVLAASLVATPPAEAHPLGNFTINRYAGIEVVGRDVYVRYALDVAEIPTYQLGGELRAPGYAGRLADRLVLTLDGERSPLHRLRRRDNVLPFGCQQVASARPIKERHAECPLQAGDSASHCCVLDSETTSGRRDPATACHGKKSLQSIPIHGCALLHNGCANF